jgi:hypothetical protein
MLMVVSYCWSERTSLANSRCRRGGSGRKRAFHEQHPIAQVVGHVKWRNHYDTLRPHSALGYRPPAPQTVPPNIIHLDHAA